jgi:hypothetical protein
LPLPLINAVWRKEDVSLLPEQIESEIGRDSPRYLSYPSDPLQRGLSTSLPLCKLTLRANFLSSARSGDSTRQSPRTWRRCAIKMLFCFQWTVKVYNHLGRCACACDSGRTYCWKFWFLHIHCCAGGLLLAVFSC